MFSRSARGEGRDARVERAPRGASVWWAVLVIAVFRPPTLLMAGLVLVFDVDAFLVGAPIPLALGFE